MWWTAPQKLDTQSNLWGVFMSKYSKDIKLIAVRRYLQSNKSLESIAKQLEIDPTSMQLWVRHYEKHGIAALEKKYSHYSAQLKLLVLRYIQKHGCSNKDAAAHFDIRNPGSIANWSRQYQTGGFNALIPKRKGRPTMARKKPAKKSDQDRSRDELLKELEYLRAENAFLKKLDALIQEEEKMAGKKQPPSKG